MGLLSDAEALGDAHEIRERVDSHLSHDLRAVQLDILFPGSEVESYLLIESPGDDVL